MFKRVLLPEPETPIMAKNSPFSTSKSISLSTSISLSPSLYIFFIFLKEIIEDLDIFKASLMR